MKCAIIESNRSCKDFIVEQELCMVGYFPEKPVSIGVYQLTAKSNLTVTTFAIHPFKAP